MTACCIRTHVHAACTSPSCKLACSMQSASTHRFSCRNFASSGCRSTLLNTLHIVAAAEALAVSADCNVAAAICMSSVICGSLYEVGGCRRSLPACGSGVPSCAVVACDGSRNAGRGWSRMPRFCACGADGAGSTACLCVALVDTDGLLAPGWCAVSARGFALAVFCNAAKHCNALVYTVC